MLRRYVDLRPAVEMYIASDDSLKQYALLNAEWELLEELLKLFKPLYIATVGLSQSKYVSISLTLSIYIGLTRLTRLEKKKEIAFGFFWRILYI